MIFFNFEYIKKRDNEHDDFCNYDIHSSHQHKQMNNVEVKDIQTSKLTTKQNALKSRFEVCL
jgi:hypothetical protein